jgi:hypothetical protein
MRNPRHRLTVLALPAVLGLGAFALPLPAAAPPPVRPGSAPPQSPALWSPGYYGAGLHPGLYFGPPARGSQPFGRRTPEGWRE